MEEFSFSNNEISLACEKIGEFLTGSGVEGREVLRTKLTFEEILLDYQEKFGQEASFKLKCARRFSSIRVEVVVPGDPFNPLDDGDEENDISQVILSRIGIAPSWGYKNGKNSITITPNKKPISDAVKMFATIGLGVIVGVILNLLPESVRTGANEYVLSPVSDTFLGLISAMAGPLVFLSVLNSIVSMGNLETLGKIGKKTIMFILVYTAIICLAMTLFACFFFDMNWGEGGFSSIKSVLDMLYDIIPSNFVDPFLTGNALQIISLSIMIGLAMLVLSAKVNGVCSIIEQLNSIVQLIMQGVSSFLPVLIFVMLSNVISSGSFGVFLTSWKILVGIVVLDIVFYLAIVLWISLRKKVSFVLLLKKAWSTFFIAMTTASSGAAFATNVKTAHESMGIDKKLVGFGIPIGQVLFMPGFISELVIIEFGLAQSAGIYITFSWILISLVTNLLLSYAIPPIPGGGTMCFAIVFSQLGIPAEMMGIAIAIDIIVDFIGTPCSVSGWQITLIDVADSLDMLDKKTLRKAD